MSREITNYDDFYDVYFDDNDLLMINEAVILCF